MNPKVRLGLMAAVAVMALVAAAAIGWKWRAGELGAGGFRGSVLAPALLVALPLISGALIVFADRQLAAHRPRLSADHRRHLHGALVFWFAVLTGLTAWLAHRYLRPAAPVPGGLDFARLAGVLMGVAMAVRGNFFAKLSPPTGEGAPDPAAWTRAALRTGWLLSVTGAGLTLAAIALPLKPLLIVYLATAPLLVGVGLLQRRAMRHGARP